MVIVFVRLVVNFFLSFVPAPMAQAWQAGRSTEIPKPEIADRTACSVGNPLVKFNSDDSIHCDSNVDNALDCGQASANRSSVAGIRR